MTPTELSLEEAIGSAKRAALLTLAQYYIYDLSAFLDGPGGWVLPDSGAYPLPDSFGAYWDKDGTPAEGRHAFLVRHKAELAGFVLIRTGGLATGIDVHIGEFFIINKKRRLGLGRAVFDILTSSFPGTWEVMQLLKNKPSIQFWERLIADHTGGSYKVEQRLIPDPVPHSKLVMTFTARPSQRPIQ